MKEKPEWLVELEKTDRIVCHCPNCLNRTKVTNKCKIRPALTLQYNSGWICTSKWTEDEDKW